MSSINKFVLIIFLFAGVFSIFIPAIGQSNDDIILSLKSGNAKTLSGYFNQNVELVVPDNDNVYSKAQAQQIVSNFFNVHTPVNFAIIHSGGKDGAKHVIGKLTTKEGEFRVYYLLKQTDGKDFIHLLKIEKQE